LSKPETRSGARLEVPPWSWFVAIVLSSNPGCPLATDAAHLSQPVPHVVAHVVLALGVHVVHVLLVPRQHRDRAQEVPAGVEHEQPGLLPGPQALLGEHVAEPLAELLPALLAGVRALLDLGEVDAAVLHAVDHDRPAQVVDDRVLGAVRRVEHLAVTRPGLDPVRGLGPPAPGY